ncbi:MAG: tandem-95 repeat protein [Flavobacteriales bacterium]|nr:tandem-95 repeat protein [Flavobacteriales bacterium]
MKRLLIALVSCFPALSSHAQIAVCGTPGADGPANAALVVNTYYTVPGALTLAAGSSTLSLGAVPANDAFGNTFGTLTIEPGDLLLIIQMQDADINTSNSNLYGGNNATGGPDALGGTGFTALNNTGRYEYVVATSSVPLTGGTLTFRGGGTGSGTIYTYTNQDGSATLTQKRFQVVRVPQYSNLTLTSNLVCPPWNGYAGGIVAFDVAGAFAFGGFTISANGRGFRAGYQDQAVSGANLANTFVTTSLTESSGKGENIAGTPRYMWDGFSAVDLGASWNGFPSGDFGRGAPGNGGGGGNDHNAGGGGGANGGAGGVGGIGWEGGGGSWPNGGRPGTQLTQVLGRLFLGGGGGGGDANNALTGVKGGVGGGLVIINAGRIDGTGTITANGDDGDVGAYGSAPDGAGGGGAAGTIFVNATQNSPTASLTLIANGGRGGNTLNDSGFEHGPGGGGGGGAIWYNVVGGTVSTSVVKGLSGKASGGSGIAHGAADGQDGVAASFAFASLPGYLQGQSSTCYPTLVVTKTSESAQLGVGVPQGANTTYSLVITNTGTAGNAGGVQLDDILAAGITYVSATVVYGGGAAGPASLTNLGTASQPRFGNFNIPAGGVVTITMTVTVGTAQSPGTYQNGAQVRYLDPTRSSADPSRRISPAINAYSGADTAYETGGATVLGSNYSDAVAGPVVENVLVLAYPIAGDDALNVNEDATLNASLAGGDSDADDALATLTWSLLSGGTAAANGSLTVNANGTFSYTPNANVNGSVSFTYQVCDNDGLCDDATATIAIAAVNDAPVAVDDAYPVNEDGTITAQSVAGNDSDPDNTNAQLTWSITAGGTAAANGTLSMTAAGAFTYTPNTNFNGTVSFTYQACDPSSACDPATVTITVTAVNDAPVAGDDAFTTNEDASLTNQSLTANDNDPDNSGAQLTWSLVNGGTAAVNGTLTVNANGTFSFVPNTNYNGSVSFTYQVCDPSNACDPATVTITVNAVNDGPVADDDNFTVVEDGTLNASLGGNDSDPDHTSVQLAWSLVGGGTAAANGSLTVNANGTFTYTPNANFTGSVSFTYQLCDPGPLCDPATATISVGSANDAPIAGDDVVSVSEDGTLNAAVTGNDLDPDGDPLTYGLVSGGTAATNGSLTFNANGSYSYTPNANFTGVVAFTYEACDPSSVCDAATVTITVSAVNDVPVAGDDSFNTTEDAALTAQSVTGNDSDPDHTNAQLTWSLVSGGTAATNGTLVFNANGTFTWTPNANYNGTVTFTYQACDPLSACDPATATITVNSLNDAPVANDDSFSTTEDAALTAQSVTGNDSDPDHTNAQLTWSLVSGGTAATNGTLVFNANGAFTWTPNADYSGTVTFTYQACDPVPACDPATVTIVVAAQNDPPVAGDDSFSLNEDGSLAAQSLTTNDSDPDNSNVQLTWSLVSGGSATANGALTVNANGTFAYTPAANYSGAVSFTYQVCDPSNACDPATVTITVNAVNDAPVANDDPFTVNEDGTLNNTVSGNDSDVDNTVAQLTWSVVSGGSAAANGSLTFNADGTFTYVPNANYNGSVSFTYQVCDPSNSCDPATATITVTATNDQPVAGNDAFTMAEDASLSAQSLTANDSDPDHTAAQLTWSLVSGGTASANGSLTVNANGTFAYAPNANYNGTVTFTYQVCDPLSSCATASVSIIVTAVNDGPLANDDAFTVLENGTLSNALSGNDSDVDNTSPQLTWSLLSGGTASANGSLTVNANGTFTYTPTAGFNGLVSFTYQICDPGPICEPATVTIDVGSVNDQPTAGDDAASVNEDNTLNAVVTGNDSDPDGDALTYALVSGGTATANGALTFNVNGSYSYLPNANYNGTVSFTYQACDPGALCDQAVVTITVTAVNDAPVANDDAYSMSEDGTLANAVSGNDSDVEGALNWSLVSGGTATSNGVLSLNATGTFTYTPNANHNGTVSFTYQVCDAGGLCDPATVTITINAANDAPVAGDDAFTMNEDATLSDVLSANDSDPETPNTGLTWSLVAGGSAAANGAIAVNANGTFDYVPATNFSGVVSFTYQVCDPSNACDPATVTITINAANDPPVATDDSFTMSEDGALSNALSGNDNDLETPNNGLVWSLVGGGTAAANGSLSVNADGTFTYTPNANYNGTVSFTYQVCDPSSACDAATVTITIGAVNDAPEANDDGFSVNEDGSLSDVLSSNDSDAETANSNLVWSLVSGGTAASNGVLTVNANGSFTYVPNTNSSGAVSFTYQVCDPSNACDPATVTINVNAVNDPPVAADDAFSMNEDGVLADAVGGNDSDTETPNNGLTWSLVSGGTAAATGTLLLNVDGTFTFTPNANANGSVNFTYQVCDAASACDPATVVITIAPINDAPVALDDNYPMAEDGTLTTSVVGNDSDVDNSGAQLAWSLVSGGTAAANGLLSFNANGGFVYQPDAGFSGIVTFTYQVCDPSNACDNATVTIDVGSTNDIPVAEDDAAAMDEDGVLNSTVVGNDSDADSDPLTWSLVNGGSAATNGTLVLDPNGSYVYTPNPNFNGVVSFTYQACDPANACDQAVVTISVNAINDGPVANDDGYSMQEDGVLNANVSGNDSDVDNTSGQLAWGLSNGGTAAANGSLSVGPNGAFSYTPDPGFSGTVTFDYQVCDPAPLCDQATVTIVVDAVNDTPEALDDAFSMNEGGTLVASSALNDSDADHVNGLLTWSLLSGGTAAANGVLTYGASGSFTFVPSTDVNGTFTFTYQVCDPLGACDAATVTIVVTPVNDPPIAQDDIFLMNEDALLNATVTINDNDIDDIAAQLAWTIVNGGTAAANGVLSMSSDGNFSYAPALDFSGTVAFTYQVCDPGGACEPATVTITVAPVNDPPVATDDAASTDEDLPVNITITTNDLDVDGNLVLGSITIIAPPTNGSVSIVNGIATYTPNPGITGTDAFTYSICDDGTPLPSQCDQAVVVITINGINDTPQPANDVFSGVEDGGAVTGDLGANDFDPDHTNAQLTWTLVSGGNAASNGLLVVDPDGTISFTPNADVNGTFSFIYEVCDPDGACVQAVCDITIAPVNDAPGALDDTDNTPPNTQVTSNVIANDSDPQDVAGGIDPGSVIILVLPVNGTATVNGNGTITYDPTLNYTGLDSLQYQVCDLGDAAPTLCATAWLVITVNGDLPIAQDDFAVTPEDIAVIVDVLDNDSTLNGVLVPGSVVIVDPPQNGTAVVNPDGTITYTPDPNYNGVDDFNYQFCNDLGFCSQGTLTVVVDPVNDPLLQNPMTPRPWRTRRSRSTC